jgi:hypothetical protein
VFMVFLFLCATQIFVFLNSFVIVLFSGPKYVKVTHFFFVLISGWGISVSSILFAADSYCYLVFII